MLFLSAECITAEMDVHAVYMNAVGDPARESEVENYVAVINWNPDCVEETQCNKSDAQLESFENGHVHYSARMEVCISWQRARECAHLAVWSMAR